MAKYSPEFKLNNIFHSISRKGNCSDNSPMKNFFGVFKQEKYYGKTFETYEELKEAIDYYNYKRIKRKLAGMSQFNTEFIPAN